jgi:hypothetical protein
MRIAAMGFPLAEGGVQAGAGAAEAPAPDQARLVFAVGLP